MAGCGVEGSEAAGVISLDTTPLFEIRIDADDGVAGLAVISDATLLPDGGVAVLDKLNDRVYVYDSAGHLATTFGRNGAGPGEFKIPSIIISCGLANPIGVWDPALSRLTMFGRGGNLLEVVSLSGTFAKLACHDGQVIASEITGDYTNLRPDAPPVSGELRIVWPVADTVLLLTDVNLGRTLPLREIAGYVSVDSLIIFGTAANDSLIVISRLGAPHRVFRLGLTLRSALAHQYEAAIVAQSRQLPLLEDQLVAQQYMRKMPPPDKLPYFRNLAAGSGNQLWVTTSAFGDSLTTVNVYDIIAERQIGTATLSMDATILGISKDRMLVKFPDLEMGGDRLVVYRMN
jgi:hypothetical protein